MAAEITECIERGLRIARAAERAGEVARLVAQRFAIGAENGSEQAQKRTPPFHVAPEIMHGLSGRLFRVRNRSPSVSKDRSRDAAQGLVYRHIRLQGRLVAHVTVL
jgi:hypothetical protein